MKSVKNIPLSLKILSGVLVFWSVMTLLTIKFAYDIGYPLFGIVFSGVIGFSVAFILVFLAPLMFVYSVWNRNAWGGSFGLGYTAFFAFNNLLALVFAKEVFGLPQIIVPMVANIVFFGVIYLNRNYFK